jgi:hypothetical protein
MSLARPNCIAISLALAAAQAHARKWTDSTGKYTVEADLVAADRLRAVLQNSEHRLISIDLDKLSKADQDYVKTELKQRQSKKNLNTDQVWTMKSGLKVRARVVAYGQREMLVQVHNGQLYVNDRRFDNLPEIYQKMVPKIIDHFESDDLQTEADFKAWVAGHEGATRRYQLNGVALELDNGDRYAVPFFFFSDKDLKVLQPGWERWAAAKEDADRERENFYLSAQAQAYQQDPAANQQVSQLQLGLLGTIAGVTSMWEVQLYPGPGVAAQPMSVIVFARDSRSAVVSALNGRPGYVAGPVRRLN